MKALIHITLKPGVLDPQGKAIANALSNLGFGGIGDVRQGKYIEIELPGRDAAAAEADVASMCERLLANTVIEDYRVEIVDNS
jgi:phosphoribosylformylglycinamidine synthase PurS subunit